MSTADGPRGPRRPSRTDAGKSGRRGPPARPGARPDRRSGETAAKSREERTDKPAGKGLRGKTLSRSAGPRSDAPRSDKALGEKPSRGRPNAGRPDADRPNMDRPRGDRARPGRDAAPDRRDGGGRGKDARRPGPTTDGRSTERRAPRREERPSRADERPAREARLPRRREDSSAPASDMSAPRRSPRPAIGRAQPAPNRRTAFAPHGLRDSAADSAPAKRRPPAMRWPAKVPAPRAADTPERAEKTREGDRIAKLLARAGVASRRDIERMIAEGRIALDGEVLTTPATVLTSLSGVTVDGNPVEEPGAARLFLFYKPVGYLTAARDPKGRPTIYDALPADLPRLMPVGRLDFNTEGLLLLTTDGGLKRQLELPSSGIERTYRARAFGEISQDQLEDLIEGIEIDGMRYGRIDANLERRTGRNQWIEMTITEGKNREVRRVLEHLGLEVNRLIRTRYGKFTLDDAQPGDIVEVRPNDLASFRKTLK